MRVLRVVQWATGNIGTRARRELYTSLGASIDAAGSDPPPMTPAGQ